MAARTQQRRANQQAGQKKLQTELAATGARLQHLGAERQQLQGQLQQNEAAQHQMLGRQRLLQEQLGIVEPMQDPPELAAANGDGGAPEDPGDVD